jgi:lysine 2,3-aminomutase
MNPWITKVFIAAFFLYLERSTIITIMNGILKKTISELVTIMWDADPDIRKILTESSSTLEARNQVFNYLADLERQFFNIDSKRDLKKLHICKRNVAKECIRVLKNILRTENEALTGYSALNLLTRLSREPIDESSNISPGFIMEFIALFTGINGKAIIGDETLALVNHASDPQLQSKRLNAYAKKLNQSISAIPTGTDPELAQAHDLMKQKILSFFKGTEQDWKQYKWHIQHIIRDLDTLKAIVPLSPEEDKGLQSARKNGIPFQITPYYLSLFHISGPNSGDRAIRAQVLPGQGYCESVARNRRLNVDMDFMGEKSTSPIEGITRRYPQIVILKPIDTCPQLCVYCQRNWEIKPINQAGFSEKVVDNAINWIRDNHQITEVLITGGDPLMLSDAYIKELLNKLAMIDHVERIRIGTRIPVTLPFRITPELVAILKRHHVLGVREVCLVTHFEHPTEITRDSMDAIRLIREAGLSIYNQQVFTYFNSLRYETCALRRALKISGIDPYYSFNTKGKEETSDFRVPIARIEQERKEEARFLPGMVRTDEPVFNVPKLGKSHLRSWQDHEIIMITPAGERIYRFYPWEAGVTLVNDYLYRDIPIFDYLHRLDQHNQHPEKYNSIWYYF